MTRLAFAVLFGLFGLGAAQWYGIGPYPGFVPHQAYYPAIPYWDYPWWGYNPHYRPQPQQPQPKIIFYGSFPGKCAKNRDGLYYIDDSSFAFCSGGQYTVQPCAPGSANPPSSYFQKDQYYGTNDFCSVNLVARGYNSPDDAYVKAPASAAEPETGATYAQSSTSYERKQSDGYVERKRTDKKERAFQGRPQSYEDEAAGYAHEKPNAYDGRGTLPGGLKDNKYPKQVANSRKDVEDAYYKRPYQDKKESNIQH